MQWAAVEAARRQGKPGTTVAPLLALAVHTEAATAATVRMQSLCRTRSTSTTDAAALVAVEAAEAAVPGLHLSMSVAREAQPGKAAKAAKAAKVATDAF